MRTLFKAMVYGTPERENPGIYSMFSIRSVEYTFSDSIRCVSTKSVNIKSIQAVLKTILFLVFVCRIHVSGIEIIIWRRDCVN
jgi:hypothetical protein